MYVQSISPGLRVTPPSIASVEVDVKKTSRVSLLIIGSEDKDHHPENNQMKNVNTVDSPVLFFLYRVGVELNEFSRHQSPINQLSTST